jgi:AcrR family transcriptional regulator
MTAPPTPLPTTPLAPRRSPRQARSRERHQRILDATAELLEEAGVEGLSTRLIASRAGVNVATIYQFFPNKYAVLNALAERTASRLLQGYLQLVGSIPSGAPIAETSERILDGFVRAVAAMPGFFPLRRAMQVLPELAAIQAIEERTKRAIAGRIMERLTAREPDIGDARREAIAQTMIQMTLSMIELMTQTPPEQRADVQRELRTLMISYLGHYFGEGAASART